MCYELPDWIKLSTQLNEFEVFTLVYNDELEFIIIKRTLKTFLEKSFNKTMYK